MSEQFQQTTEDVITPAGSTKDKVITVENMVNENTTIDTDGGSEANKKEKESIRKNLLNKTLAKLGSIFSKNAEPETAEVIPKTIKEFKESATEIEKTALNYLLRYDNYLNMAKDPKKVESFIKIVKRFVKDPSDIMRTVKYNKDKTGFEVNQGFRVN